MRAAADVGDKRLSLNSEDGASALLTMANSPKQSFAANVVAAFSADAEAAGTAAAKSTHK